MNPNATWALDPKLLDAYLRNLNATSLSDVLRRYEVVLLPDGSLDVHASAYARAYRVRGPNSSTACLRFWSNLTPPTILETYSALECAPEVRARCGLSQVKLFSEVLEIQEKVVPAILMDWVEGDALSEVVNANLDNSQELLRIAEALRSAFVLLNSHRISHGDLRSSNVRVGTDKNSVRIGLIDLDSLRWYQGPTAPRVIGGNRMWDQIRKRDDVLTLESDYLDQAMAYLTVVAVAADRSWWRGPTDAFLTLGHLKVSSEEALRQLEQMNGMPARLATTVRRVMEEQGHWPDVADAMQEPTGSPLTELTEEEFWGMVTKSRLSRVTVLREVSQPTTPALRPTEVSQLGGSRQTEVPKPVSAVPSQPANRLLPWLWVLVVATVVLVVSVIYWLHKG